MAEANFHSTDNMAPKRKKVSSVLVFFFSGVVLAFIAVALWISANSILEKIHIAQGLQQVINVVTMAREAAKADPTFLSVGHKDLLDTLERSSRIQTNGTVGGVKMIQNPWNKTLIALMDADGNVRIETIVPSHICQRFIGSFGRDPQSFGIKQVEVKSFGNTWRQVYNGAVGGGISETTIFAGCGDDIDADTALTFSLR